MNSKLQNLKDLLKENPAAAEKAKAIPAKVDVSLLVHTYKP